MLVRKEEERSNQGSRKKKAQKEGRWGEPRGERRQVQQPDGNRPSVAPPSCLVFHAIPISPLLTIPQQNDYTLCYRRNLVESEEQCCYR